LVIRHGAIDQPFREIRSIRPSYEIGKAIFLVSGIQTANRATGNLFLDNLPDKALDALLPVLVHVPLKNGQIVSGRDAPMEKVLFPIGGVLSVVLDMSDGDTAEIGIIGREGMSGLTLVLGLAASKQRTVVQIPDGAKCIGAADFRAALQQEPELKSFALRYAQAVLMSTSQLSACNSLHPANERCARWLLMAHDRVGADLLLLTQEFLGQMLGVRRGSVTLAASALQEAGFIAYSRGHINIRNRAGLESASCECYEAMERDWESIMGYSVRKGAPDLKPPSPAKSGNDGVLFEKER
jgi:CRP-like cAMP-binding protein